MRVNLDTALFFRGSSYGPGLVDVPEELATRRNLKPASIPSTPEQFPPLEDFSFTVAELVDEPDDTGEEE